ncbi:MAG: metallophosphoesterase family protein [Hungatella sp.]
MRILHTSDWHLGKYLDGNSRLDEQKEFVEELCRICDQEEIELILLAGDVYDNGNPSAQAEELFYKRQKN